MYQPLVQEESPFDSDSTPGDIICGTYLHHCALRNTSLRVCKDGEPTPVQLHSSILNLDTGQCAYKLYQDKFPLHRDVKYVVDAVSGVPLVRSKGPLCTLFKSKFRMRSGFSSEKVLTTCKMRVGGRKVQLEVHFEDALRPGVKHTLYLLGSRWTREFDVALNHPKTGRKVAKIVQPKWKMEGTSKPDKTHIHVAQGVDLAIILTMYFVVDSYLNSCLFC